MDLPTVYRSELLLSRDLMECITAHLKTVYQVNKLNLIVEKYLKDNPDKLHEKASLLAYVALMQAFHCAPK